MVVLTELHVIAHCPPGLDDVEADGIRTEAERSLRRWAEQATAAAEGRFTVTVEP
jgi:hypothetical protein